MSDSDFEDFEEPEESEIIGENQEEGGEEIKQEEVKEKQEDKQQNKQEQIEDKEEKKDEQVVEEDKQVVEKDKQVDQPDTQENIQEPKQEEEKVEISPKIEEKEISDDIKSETKDIIHTPEKKKVHKNISSAQKPSSTFHPISQDSDINPNSKLSESFTMITNETKAEDQSAIDIKTDCSNLISPNNQKTNHNQETLKETKSLHNNKISPEVKKIVKKNKKFPLIRQWIKENDEPDIALYSIESQKTWKIFEDYSKNEIKNKKKRGTRKSLLSKLKKLKIYRKLAKKKEEIQNNSCKEMKGLNKAESELLNEFLDSLMVLPETVNKDLFEI